MSIPMPSAFDARPSIPPLGTRALRTLGVAGAWLFSALPLVVGVRCNVARFLHAPCPGCGMTRAVHLLEAGDVVGSLRMHALTVPIALTSAFFAAVTLWLTFTIGTPLRILESRVGRASIILLLSVHVASVLLWVLRMFGLFGGPVSVAAGS
jgi:hypothetical protein